MGTVQYRDLFVLGHMKYCPRLRLGTIYIMCPLTNKSLYCTVDWEIKPHYLSDTNTVITPMDQINDLGVILSSNCQFKNQINDIVKTANKHCAWILRTFKTRAPKLMILLWKSLVLSKVDYCSQLWSPTVKG